LNPLTEDIPEGVTDNFGVLIPEAFEPNIFFLASSLSDKNKK
jgi:hypothetical protein